MERLLSQIFSPNRDLPVKSGLRGGTTVEAGTQKLPIPLPPSEKEILLNPVVTHNYQDYRPGTFVKLRTGYIKLTKIVATSTEKYAFGSELVLAGETGTTKLPILRDTGRTLFVSFGLILHTCNVVQTAEGNFVVNFENK